MTTASEWVIEQRAKYLAIVHFTRREDLFISRIDDSKNLINLGIDLLVSILTKGKETGRIFGVKIANCQPTEVQNTSDGMTVKIAVPTIQAELPFPICFVVFNLETDEGYYRWLTEIKTHANDSPSVSSNALFQPLNRESLDMLIGAVNDWYNLAKGRAGKIELRFSS